MMRSRRTQFVTLLIILLAVITVGMAAFTENSVQAQYYCYDPCDSWCWGT